MRSSKVNPPDLALALVLCVDGKTQAQALDPTQPLLRNEYVWLGADDRRPERAPGPGAADRLDHRR